MSEFSVIDRYFSSVGKTREDVLVGVGDDAAVVDISDISSLAISVDTFIEGVHFPVTTSAYDVGWKSLAVNLSDMAAMAAKPRWVTLALTLPKIDANWLAEFSRGFSDLARQFDVQLIGGDTTCGALSISVQIVGSISEWGALKRSDAKVGDGIYVTGYLGDAALGLKSLSEDLPITDSDKQLLLEKLNQPQAKVKEALNLAAYINAAIDISDGLSADLLHILKASSVAGCVDVTLLPLSESYQRCHQESEFYDLALCGGDDYELCFTVAGHNEEKFLAVAEEMALKCTRIGDVVEGNGLELMRGAETYEMDKKAYEHF